MARKGPVKKRKAAVSGANSTGYLNLKTSVLLLFPIVAGIILARNYGIIQLPSLLSSSYDAHILRDRTIFDVARIAIRDIEVGELIIQEHPVLLLPNRLPLPELPIALKQLPQKSLRALLELSHCAAPGLVSISDIDTQSEEDRIEMTMSIMNSNAFGLGNDNMLGVFPRVARINHACVGAINLIYHYQEREDGSPGEIWVRAIKPIKAGEELALYYMDTRFPRAERQEYLMQNYGFLCECSTCSLPKALSEKSDERLVEIDNLYKTFNSWAIGNISSPEAIDVARHVIELENQEEYYHDRAKLTEEAAWIAASASDENATKEWSGLSVKWHIYVYGQDDFRTRALARSAATAQLHPQWGKGIKALVSKP
ncbi:hypothetical protein DL96DRAFT_1591655 [Flagelloscypha sp. PMI_526]|nr:hypothetical protein DL96DRAFT_1591655 [Flagelloscypha sp. PMI_526]